MTLREIAQELGVAPSTVSFVLNSKPGVGDELRSRIREQLIANGYEIKSGSTVNKTGGSIALINYKSTGYLANRQDGTVTLIMAGLDEVFSKYGCTISIINATEQNLGKALVEASKKHVGIIMLGTEMYQNFDNAFARVTVPFVVLDAYLPESPYNTINMENDYGINQLVKLLVKNRHMKIGYFKSGIEFGCLRDRAKCVYDACARFGVELPPEYVVDVSQEPVYIKQEVSAFIENTDTLPTAFIADNDTIAASAIQSLQSAGFEVPDDVSIVGFDDNVICTILTPSITTVRASFYDMAVAAAKRLTDMITTGDKIIIKSTVGVELVERETVTMNNGRTFVRKPDR